MRILFERERVHVGLDVARAAGIGVVAPRTADLVGFLQHDEVLPSVFDQLDRHAEAGESGSDDDHTGLGAITHVRASMRRFVLPGVHLTKGKLLGVG